MAQQNQSPSTPPKRPSLGGRDSSTSNHSINDEQQSPPRRNSGHKLHKAHAGHSRLAPARNTSYGKNLSKLNKIGADGRPTSSHSKSGKAHSPAASPPSHNFKRDSSNMSLAQAGGKVNVKRNSSNLSLKRVGSEPKIAKPQKQEVKKPVLQPQTNGIVKTAEKVVTGFSIGDKDHDEDWTEESASQSPSTTRRSSLNAGSQLGATQTQMRNPRSLPQSPPQSPLSRTSSAKRFDSPTDALTQSNGKHQSTPKHAPGLRSTPPGVSPKYNDDRQSQGSSNGTTQPSMPEAGVSRFLDAPSESFPRSTINSGRSSITRPPSTSPRAATSAFDLQPHSESTITLQNVASTPILNGSASAISLRTPPAYLIGQQPRRAGGNTQAKMNLWRSREDPEVASIGQTNVGAGQVGERGGRGNQQRSPEEERQRLWEEAQRWVEEVRTWKDPLLESVKRTAKRDKKENGKKGWSGEGEVMSANGDQELASLLRRMWDGEERGEVIQE
ncbi:hypothetical protein MMC25_006824 [Agyrium rufum]|nr:hypothetical protein [Agyrium rufum]